MRRRRAGGHPGSVTDGYWIRARFPTSIAIPIKSRTQSGLSPLRSLAPLAKTTIVDRIGYFLTALLPSPAWVGVFCRHWNEGDCLYMPTRYPVLSVQKAIGTAAADRRMNQKACLK